MATCCLCLVAVPASHNRRRLYSQGSAVVLAQLKDLADRWGYGSLLPSKTAASGEENPCFLCKPCFSVLEKTAKARRDLAALEDGVQCKLRQIAVSCGFEPCSSSQPELSEAANAGSDATPKKRQKRSLEKGQSPTPKRRRVLMTPVRKAVERTHAEKSPAVMVVVKKQAKARVSHLSRSLRKLGRSVGRLNRSSIARQAMNDRRIKERILKVLGEHVRKEMKAMCSLKEPSILRDTSPETMHTFKSEALIEELQRNAPTLAKVLRECCQRTRRPNPQKTHRIKDDHIIALCAAILLRHRNMGMNLVQRINSLLLYSSHAPKQLFTRLQKMLLCLSHSRTIAYVDVLEKDHDAPVHVWRERLQQVTSDGATHQEENMTTCAEEEQVGDAEAKEADQDKPDSPSDITSESSPSSTHFSAESSSDDGSLIPPELTAHSEESSQLSSAESEIYRSVFGTEETHISTPAYPSFKIVGDNLDRYVKPREMRSDVQSQMLNYFNIIAVRDRIDASQLDDHPSLPDPSTIQVDHLLSSPEDQKAIHSNLSILVARVLKKHMKFFNKFGSGLEKHIHHQYDEELSQKSEVVPLGILRKSEMKHDDMISILDHLHQYVPTQSVSETAELSGSSDTIDVTVDYFHHILFGGDLLTAKRARGAQRIRGNSERGKDRLQGLVPVVEDWHAKVCLLTVIWKRLYSGSSRRDAGTLYHLRNLINRRNVVSVPKNGVAACEEFFLLVVEAHILAAAMQLFGMSTLDDKPANTTLFPEASSSLDSLQRRNVLVMATKELVTESVNFSYPALARKEDDHVQAYAREVLSLGLLLMEFVDAIREGDGLRILCCWRFFLPIFKASNRTNYSLEALNFLVQHDLLFTPRMRQQLLWERTINVHGKRGKNIPCDLHLEHVNRNCKNSLGSLGPNLTDESVSRVGKCVGELEKVTRQFDSDKGIKEESGKHSKRSVAVDLQKILKELHEDSKIFHHIPGRKHSHFPAFHTNVTKQLKQDDLKLWMHAKTQELLMYQ